MNQQATGKPVCLVIGAGAGIGGSVGKHFAANGYHATLARRSNVEGLTGLVDEIKSAGGSATGRIINAVEPGAIQTLISETEAEVGPIDVIVFNLGAQIGSRPLGQTTEKQFELGWRMACLGLFQAAQAAMPAMVERGSGCFLVTSSTAAVRGNAGQHSHAAAMAGRRMLCQTLNAEFGPKGIHIAHIIIDGAVDAPDTLGKMMGEKGFAKLRETVGADDGLLDPAKIAETYYHLAHQHRSVWTHELDMRAWSDQAWWNHSKTLKL